MNNRRLGETGLQVSPLCFGTWRFGKEQDGVVETGREEAHELLDAFAERGGNFIDTANGYGNGDSEQWIGEWLADRDREDFVIASKCYWSTVSRFQENLSRKNVRAEVEGSLERLGTDYLDILYLHRFDDETPIETTLRTIDDLVSEGKVHYVGISTCDAWKLTKGLWKADVNNYEAFSVTQPLFHAAYYEDVTEYLEVCADQNLAVCPYSPLAGGFLTGKYERVGDGTYDLDAPEGTRAELSDRFTDFYVSERGWHVLDAVRDVADEVNATPAQVALRWLMDQPDFDCVPIIGARTVDQLDENLGAVDISLTDEQFDCIFDARYDENGKLYKTNA
ncbi:aldo/keto reductase [Halopiger xanaduensis]|uniref:Aryl-alcohol dehydrogenase (NADP(+)) n=1 Tax=Halopiger xanaduensis (strain DSM 18323 / JCM 14033 / SH-6) TaxID=797210 RepID=F8D8B9_HALXS|nr:aldo/keto reductase [Halopiger xanaduensis]AEH36940.1 Aryl-alcohol dehydrogenase (NADP(+)) [Halopiger xanaduensis SH-6]